MDQELVCTAITVEADDLILCSFSVKIGEPAILSMVWTDPESAPKICEKLRFRLGEIDEEEDQEERQTIAHEAKGLRFRIESIAGFMGEDRDELCQLRNAINSRYL